MELELTWGESVFSKEVFLVKKSHNIKVLLDFAHNLGFSYKNNSVNINLTRRYFKCSVI